MAVSRLATDVDTEMARAMGAHNLRALLIAPASDLEYVGEEIQRVANALHPQLLFGNVTLTGVIDALQAPYDVVWFACHGTPDGISLSDGLLQTEQLVQMLRGNCPRLIVLNTCNSLQVAMQIHDECGCAVICTVVSIPDREAFVTGSQLAAALAAGHDIQDAYNRSKPGRNRQYVLLNGSVRMNGDNDGDDTRRLMMSLLGEQARRITGIEERLTGVERKVDAGFSEIRTRVHVPTPIHRAAWLLGFIALFAPVPLFYSDVRSMLGAEWPISLLLAITCYVGSGLMFAYGNGIVGGK